MYTYMNDISTLRVHIRSIHRNSNLKIDRGCSCRHQLAKPWLRPDLPTHKEDPFHLGPSVALFHILSFFFFVNQLHLLTFFAHFLPFTTLHSLTEIYLHHPTNYQQTNPDEQDTSRSTSHRAPSF